ncbi:hypothetical protein M4D68_27760 [Priestia aryabhattai]|uniref:hypothetical protein n=1 Tax=Priestia aryabhattai TaxID=412384 RepID=UPI00203D8289|nr:hypothetical protein [Priestia aryabhattai]MCM3644911.1 hypothetical protein [Priestia aryabhattai]
MGRISRFVKNTFLKEYRVFAEELGFKSWDDVLENTYEIFKMPPDAFYLALLHNLKKISGLYGMMKVAFLIHI